MGTYAFADVNVCLGWHRSGLRLEGCDLARLGCYSLLRRISMDDFEFRLKVLYDGGSGVDETVVELNVYKVYINRRFDGF